MCMWVVSRKHISSKLEAIASELLEHLEEMFHSDAFSWLKSSTTLYYVTRRERFNSIF